VTDTGNDDYLRSVERERAKREEQRRNRVTTSMRCSLCGWSPTATNPTTVLKAFEKHEATQHPWTLWPDKSFKGAIEYTKRRVW
jgi:hypothetical protein